MLAVDFPFPNEKTAAFNQAGLLLSAFLPPGLKNFSASFAALLTLLQSFTMKHGTTIAPHTPGDHQLDLADRGNERMCFGRCFKAEQHLVESSMPLPAMKRSLSHVNSSFKSDGCGNRGCTFTFTSSFELPSLGIQSPLQQREVKDPGKLGVEASGVSWHSKLPYNAGGGT